MDENKEELETSTTEEALQAGEISGEVADEEEVVVAVEVETVETAQPIEPTEELMVAPTEEVVAVTETPAPAQDGIQPPKKKKTGLIVGIVIAAIVVGGAAFAMLGGDSGPKKIVKEAIANSYAQSEALTQQMQEEIPFMKKSAELVDKTVHADFNFKLNALSGVEGAEAFNFLFSGASIQGNVEMTPDADTMSFDGALYLLGREFISAKLYQSPDAIAFGLPSISKKIVGIDLNTYKKDIESSPLKDAGMDVDTLLDSIDEMKDSLKASNVSNKEMEAMVDKVQKMTENMLDKATYEQGETVNGITKYTVTIAPKDVKNYTVSLVEYIMMDSPFRAIYETEYEAAMAYEDGDYATDMKEALNVIRENLPDFAIEIVYDIDENTEIVRMEMNITTPNAAADDSVKLEKFTIVCENEGASSDIQGEISMSVDGETLDMILTGNAAYVDKVYNITFVLGMMMDEEQMNVSFGYEVDGNTTEDNINLEMMITVDEQELFELYCEGDAYVDGEAVVYNFDHLGMNLRDDMESMGFDFSLMMKEYAIDKVTEVGYTNLFTMSEMELMNWMMEYNNGFNQLLGNLDALE